MTYEELKEYLQDDEVRDAVSSIYDELLFPKGKVLYSNVSDL